MAKSFFQRIAGGALISALILVGVTASITSVSADSGTGTGTSPAPLVTPTSLPATSVGTYTEWSLTIAPSVTTAYSSFYWQVITGTLPDGMTLQEPNYANPRVLVIKGTPTLYGSYPIRLQLVGSDPAIERDYTLVVNAMTIEARTLSRAQGGRPYVETLNVFGGTTPHQWSVTAGQLPPGLSLSAAGVISGTPLYALTYVFTVRVNDNAGRTASREFTIVVDPDSALNLTTTALPNGTVGAWYAARLAGTGGTASYTFAVESGVFPPGLTLQSTGEITGTPSVAGTYPLNLKVTDAAGRTAARSLPIMIVAASSGSSSVSIQPATLPNGTVGTWYGYNFSVLGGTGSYQWSVTNGSLPVGLTFDTAGSIYGSPSVPGTYSFEVHARNVAGVETYRGYTVTIAAATGSTGSTGTGSTGTGSTGTGSTGSTGPSSSSAAVDAEVRVRNLDRIGVNVHALVKLPDDGNPATQADSAVYYVGADGRRHAFPNSRVYATWYSDFSGVTTVSAGNLASIPLGANVTYHPGVKMVKFTTDANVYAVSTGRTLRLIGSEAVARSLYGTNWNRQIDDIPDTFYTDYNFGTTVNAEADFNPAALREAVSYVSDVLVW